MVRKVQNKGHWFNVLISLLPLWAILSSYNFYRSFLKLIEWHHRDNASGEVLSVPLLIASQIPTLFFIFAFVIAPLILTFLLYKRKNLKWCKILSIIVAVGFPYGTALGIFSFILLRRDSIKSEFIDIKGSFETSDANKPLNTDG